MEILLIFAAVILLYYRTWNYKNVIDDSVPREAYLWFHLDGAEAPGFFEKQRNIMYCITNIGTFLGVILAIYMIFGWQAALLYAVFPLNVSAVTWSVGNMYMTTTLFILTGFYFAKTFAWGVVVSLPFYYAGLHSTVSAIPYAFVAPLLLGPVQLLNIPILWIFMNGKRFKHSIRVRVEGHEKQGVKPEGFEWRRIFVMTKVMAYYAFLSCWPSRIGFFHYFGKSEIRHAKGNMMYHPTELFWMSLALLIAFGVFLIIAEPAMFWWWFLFMGIFSQFKTLGQFVTERYTHLANVAFCVALGRLLAPFPTLLAVVVTLYFYRSHLHIPAWKNNFSLFNSSVAAYPMAEENYINLSACYFKRGQFAQAINPLLLALKFSEGDKWKVYTNLAAAYGATYRFDKAIYCLKEALKTCSPDQKEKVEKKLDGMKTRMNRMDRSKTELTKIEDAIRKEEIGWTD